ncbi:MAG: CRISPR system precrRNA processing endoribonuclease RAMP protein Cas6 [Anaerolineae bacterium]
MENFTAHQLHFTCEVHTPILLNEHQGSAIRGALFHALRGQFCFNKEVKSCGHCPLSATCPICFLVATRDPQSKRGVEVPRPYTIEPPLERMDESTSQRMGESASQRMGERKFVNSPIRRYEPGEILEFGLSMFAQALNLFPYVVLGSQALERGGVGKRINESANRRRGRGRRRGTFVIREIAAVNSLTGERQPVLRQGDSLVQVPDVPITHQQVLQRANELAARITDRLTIEFRTPMRLIQRKHLVKEISFSPLFHRLMERLSSLAGQYCDTPLDLDWRGTLLPLADKVETVEDHTRWVELESYSTRKRGRTPTSGLLGWVTFRADDWTPFLPWLVWGEVVHVGKDAVKGNGWYVMREA